MLKTVRDGKKVVPTCPTCGCRLNPINKVLAKHFMLAGRNDMDARGCKCSLVNERFILTNRPVF